MLYKYMPCERLDVLDNLKIRFSPLTSLNDPFEELPLIDASLEQLELISEMESGFNDLWSNAKKHKKTRKYRKVLEQKKSELLIKIDKKFNPNVVGKELMLLLGDSIGVLSLSRTETSLLMWSHYASEGKGFVLAFDDNHSFFKLPDMEGKITKPISVVYSGKRRKAVPGEEESNYQKILCEKPLEWAYEEEERLFRTFLSQRESVGKDQYGKDIVLFDLPVDIIKGVYVGYRATRATKNTILSAIKNNGIKCTVYNSRICNDEYRVKFDKIEIT